MNHFPSTAVAKSPKVCRSGRTLEIEPIQAFLHNLVTKQGSDWISKHYYNSFNLHFVERKWSLFVKLIEGEKPNIKHKVVGDISLML